MSMPAESSPNVAETRLFNAVKVELDGRFMLPSGAEHACKIVEMSTGEMIFVTPVAPKLTEKIIVYISELGRFEGVVVRREPDGFAISLRLTELKHRKLAEQLVWFANRDLLELPESRRHRRIVPMMQRVVVHLNNGKERIGKINDLSATSVNVDVIATVLVGSQVVLGSRAATVTRVFEGGFVADFAEPFIEGELDETTRL